MFPSKFLYDQVLFLVVVTLANTLQTKQVPVPSLNAHFRWFLTPSLSCLRCGCADAEFCFLPLGIRSCQFLFLFFDTVGIGQNRIVYVVAIFVVIIIIGGVWQARIVCYTPDEVIDQKIQAALQSGQTTVTGKPTPLASTTAASLLPGCADLAMLDCHLLVNICPLVSCHQVCDPCC